MIRGVAVSAVLLAVSSAAMANTFTVRHTRSAGTGSLRWAIKRANEHGGGDDIVFRSGLQGRGILLRSPLPEVRDDRTRIFGDINDDGAPDIALNGKFAGACSGLTIKADHCVIDGLAILNFEQNGIRLVSADRCVIRSCHVGVNLAGTNAVRNDGHQIWVYNSHENIIGGLGPSGRNVIAAGSASPERSGIHLANSCRNHIRNNNIGLARDGVTPLTPPQDSGVGITLASLFPVALGLGDGETPAAGIRTQENLIGGTAAKRNVIGSMRTGIRIRNADANYVRNNYVGLARNGRTVAGIVNQCIRVDGGSKGNFLGGALGQYGNVFAGGSYGIYITDAGTVGNSVKGSYFGLTASGTAQRPLTAGIVVSGSAGKQWIGGSSDEDGNFFCPKHSGKATFGVLLFFGGEGTSVHRNRFGVRPDDKPAAGYDYGVSAIGVYAFVSHNLFRQANAAVDCSGTPEFVNVLGNVFHDCNAAVKLRDGAQANLGNLGNGSSGDDGWNEFHYSNTWYIRNETQNFVKAEGNHFPPTGIDEKIWDWEDDHSLGRVDYTPAYFDLPQPRAARLAVLGGAAAPVAGGGAEIAFSLSASADVTVTVLNIAGRPVATVCREREAAAGLQRMIWTGRTTQGTQAPNGTYLVRIVARDGEGQQAQSLCSLRLRR